MRSACSTRPAVPPPRREELTRALEERGFEDVRRRVSGLAQFVGAGRTPA